MKKDQVDIKAITDYNPLANESLLHYSQEILVQQYVFGQPFPNLIYELKEYPHLSGGTIGPHGIIHSLRDGYILAFNGEKLQMKMYGGELICFGRIPQGYSERK